LTVWAITGGPKGAADIREETWTAVKDGDQWRLIPADGGWLTEATRTDAGGRKVTVTVVDPGPFVIDDERVAASARAAAAVYEQTTRDLRAGKFADRSSASRAWCKAAIEVIGQAPKAK
jgi:hypothetical protein